MPGIVTSPHQKLLAILLITLLLSFGLACGSFSLPIPSGTNEQNTPLAATEVLDNDSRSLPGDDSKSAAIEEPAAVADDGLVLADDGVGFPDEVFEIVLAGHVHRSPSLRASSRWRAQGKGLLGVAGDAGSVEGIEQVSLYPGVVGLGVGDEEVVGRRLVVWHGVYLRRSCCRATLSRLLYHGVGWRACD